MLNWIIVTGALIGAGAAQGTAAQEWRIHPLREGAELRYVPVVLTAKDYPTEARRFGYEGTSILNLQISRSGQLTGCSTARSSGSTLLDEQACRLYRERGRFELHGVSQPVTVQAPVRWVLLD